VANVYLRQAGIELIPDDSVLVPVSDQIGSSSLDRRVVSAAPVSAEPGHFDVKVNDQNMTFGAAVTSDALRAIRVNARNEVIVFAYVQSIAAVVSNGRLTNPLAATIANPINHAPTPRSVPPRPSARFLIARHDVVELRHRQPVGDLVSHTSTVPQSKDMPQFVRKGATVCQIRSDAGSRGGDVCIDGRRRNDDAPLQVRIPRCGRGASEIHCCCTENRHSHHARGHIGRNAGSGDER
jgi:hypothetical protein